MGDIEQRILNPQAGVADYLGGWEPTQSDLDAFLLDPYTFILSTLRERDERDRALARRLMQDVIRPVWVAIGHRIDQLPTLTQPALAEAEFLSSIKSLVGFTSQLDYVTRNLSENELRKLVTYAAELWKHKGTRGAIEPAIRMVTGNRYRALDYFDLRWVLGESPLSDEWGPASPALLGLDSNGIQSGEDGQTQYGSNPYRFYSEDANFIVGHEEGRPIAILDGTSEGLYTVSAVISVHELETEQPFPAAETTRKWRLGWWSDQFTTEVRIVDEESGEGQLNRAYLRDLFELLKPENERIRIVYLDFFDNFLVENDLDQWVALGSVRPEVSDGIVAMPVTAYIHGADDFLTDRVLTVRLRLTDDSGSFEINFLRQDDSNYFSLKIVVDDKLIQLREIVGGTPSTIASAYIDLVVDYWDVFRVQYVLDRSTNYTWFKVYFSGNLEISGVYSTTKWDDGAVALRAYSCPADVDFVELISIDADVEQVGLIP